MINFNQAVGSSQNIVYKCITSDNKIAYRQIYELFNTKYLSMFKWLN